MKKYGLILLCLVLSAVFAYAQSETPQDSGAAITAGKTASLGLEAATAFVYDLNDNSTGLETKAGIDLVFDLFPAVDRGIYPESTDSPTVRLALKDAAFTWWNTFYTAGGNYEQDTFNKWSARPLIFTFDTLTADLVWKNYFFRVAGTTTVMRTNAVSLRSVFDDVMDVNDRYYYARNQALWRTERYNIQGFPLLQGLLQRDALDMDYRGNVSGMLAGGGEFERFDFTLKAASNKKGKDNNDNAWLLGVDFDVVPIENMKFEFTGFVAMNYDKTTAGKNPYTFGTVLEYRLPFSSRMILTPFAGFDFCYEKAEDETLWEAGMGVLLYTRGVNTKVSNRALDYDDVIPVGCSLAMNINEESSMNAVLSWFEPADEEALIPNFGGFLQLELANLLGNDSRDPDFGALVQIEYAVKGKITPYIRGGWKPEITGGITRTGNKIITSAVGCYLRLVNNFSIDLRYERNDKYSDSGTETDNGLLSAVFTIWM